MTGLRSSLIVYFFVALACFGAGLAWGGAWEARGSRAALAELRAEYAALEIGRAGEAMAVLIRVRAEESAAAERAMALEGELVRTKTALDIERQAQKQKVNRVAKSAAADCSGPDPDWLRLYNEAVSPLCALDYQRAGPAVACQPGEAARTSGAAVSGLSPEQSVSCADLLSHIIDYGAYCRALEAQNRAFAAHAGEKGN